MKGKIFLLAACLALLFGCTAKQGYLESIYGEKAPQAIRACLSKAVDSDPQFYECIVSVAQGSGNSLICEQAFPASGGSAMEAKRDSCIFRSELASQDPGFCSKLSQKGFAPYCRAIVSLSEDECAAIDENLTFCLMQTGLVNFEGSGSRLAFKCSSPKRADCLADAAVQLRSPSPCEKITSTCDTASSLNCRLGFDSCYTRLAEAADNSSFCQALAKPFSGPDTLFYSPEKSVSECVLKTFGSPDKLRECSKFSGVKYGECITEYAVSAKDPEQCEKIGEGLNESVKFPIRREDYLAPGSNWGVYALSKTHDDCLTSLASSLKDASICGGVFYVDSGRHLCMLEAATAKGDESICGQISEKAIQDSCKAQFMGPG